ncbi:hypothetical protein [Erwinia sp. S38]|uniref:hypothetical protein n=1 Tax=Erwinia sp. S38 TaxID=2769338 RepID=UPI00190A6BEE|nr:hypothetical protein [Erwinia sp. S38]
MSSLANWSYTTPCTIWKPLGKDRYGQSLGWSAPLVIMADYQGGLSKRLGDIGFEQVVKNTFWTEYAEAKAGDYILIGESDNSDPIAAGADEVMQSIQYADTFERTTDDWAILTGV